MLLDRRVTEVIVAEIEPAVVAWHYEGLIDCHPAADGLPVNLLEGPRVRVEVVDVRAVVAAQTAGFLDVILLDVDNGPGYLVYDDNAAVYSPTFLRACRAALAPGGSAAVWSADSSAALLDALKLLFAYVTEHALQVQLGSRLTTYHLFVARCS